MQMEMETSTTCTYYQSQMRGIANPPAQVKQTIIPNKTPNQQKLASCHTADKLSCKKNKTGPESQLDSVKYHVKKIKEVEPGHLERQKEIKRKGKNWKGRFCLLRDCFLDLLHVVLQGEGGTECGNFTSCFAALHETTSMQASEGKLRLTFVTPSLIPGATGFPEGA